MRVKHHADYKGLFLQPGHFPTQLFTQKAPHHRSCSQDINQQGPVNSTCSCMRTLGIEQMSRLNAGGSMLRTRRPSQLCHPESRPAPIYMRTPWVRVVMVETCGNLKGPHPCAPLRSKWVTESTKKRVGKVAASQIRLPRSRRSLPACGCAS